MDVTQFDSESMEMAAPVLAELQNRNEEHGTPAIVRGDHPEFGWVVFVKNGQDATLITEHPFATFIDEG
ncbi:MAG: hypothetical protein J0I08_20735 [Rhizobiales bacterium]|nr:hypothetical protein [Hyphomicrobiales bacterium]